MGNHQSLNPAHEIQPFFEQFIYLETIPVSKANLNIVLVYICSVALQADHILLFNLSLTNEIYIQYSTHNENTFTKSKFLWNIWRSALHNVRNWADGVYITNNIASLYHIISLK